MRSAPLTLAIGSLVLIGCGLNPDSAPRPIPDVEQRALVDIEFADVGTTGSGRIYLERTDETGRSFLTSVRRELSLDPQTVMTALLTGPTEAEQQEGLRTAVPRDTTLLSARYVATDLVKVDVSSEIFQATGDDLVAAVAQIVLTLAEIDGVERVSLAVDGASVDWPRGDGSLTSEPLTIYDYPGRAVSSQPDYPAIVVAGAQP
ncbi:MAG: GerMN domain-containing protein [Actinobacteria bacterium]|nr:GerMN domain-containing protein [Actinomycetota bacterium]